MAVATQPDSGLVF